MGIQAKENGAAFLFGAVEKALVDLLFRTLSNETVERRSNDQKNAERQPGAAFTQQALREIAASLRRTERILS